MPSLHATWCRQLIRRTGLQLAHIHTNNINDSSNTARDVVKHWYEIPHPSILLRYLKKDKMETKYLKPVFSVVTFCISDSSFIFAVHVLQIQMELWKTQNNGAPKREEFWWQISQQQPSMPALRQLFFYIKYFFWGQRGIESRQIPESFRCCA